MATNRVLQPTAFLTSRGYNLTCFGHFVNLVFNLLTLKSNQEFAIWGADVLRTKKEKKKKEPKRTIHLLCLILCLDFLVCIVKMCYNLLPFIITKSLNRKQM